MHLLSADARPEVAVHELDDRRDPLEITVDGKVGHVVRVAHVRRPLPKSVERFPCPSAGEMEPLKAAPDAARLVASAVGAVGDRDRMAARLERGNDGVEVGLNAAHVADAVVGDENAHQRGTSRTHTPSSAQMSGVDASGRASSDCVASSATMS